MTHVLAAGLPLTIGLVLAVAAARAGRRPPLAAALAVGALLRLVLLVIAARDGWQPYDLAEDFRSTADTVLDGRDPLVYLREGGWHFLPFLAYVLAGQRELGELLGVPWSVVGRAVPILCDLALIPLVGRLAADPDKSGLRAFQYACAPVGVMVSAIHGQFAPITLLLGVAALVVARDGGHRAGRAHAAGILVGFAVTSASWAGLMLPGVLLALSGARSRLVAFVWTGVVPLVFLLSGCVFLGTPVGDLPATLAKSLSTRPVVGDWGWTAVATGGQQIVDPAYARPGLLILAAGVLAAAWWWRRADPAVLTLALLLAFLIATHRFGAQYLAWPMPYLIALAGRATWPAVTVSGAWAAFGYLYTTRLDEYGWRDVHVWWAYSSLVVIALLVWALPPRGPDSPRRSGSSDRGDRALKAAAQTPAP
ncbi:hypothetical protein GCM10022416_31030 [Actinomadura keratinilytica]|uniref:DUF2029 domain-containing protein n=1 Tax=Actinomadura keratinilytica TaxID=547461 RepID=A0ABP7YW40_9ACTN